MINYHKEYDLNQRELLSVLDGTAGRIGTYNAAIVARDFLQDNHPELISAPNSAAVNGYATLVSLLKELELRPNCWCQLGHWWTSPQGAHSERCKRINTSVNEVKKL